MNKLLRILVRAVGGKAHHCFLGWGLHRHRERLPDERPGHIIAGNQQQPPRYGRIAVVVSPLEQVSNVRPVAAADYFMKPGFMQWFSLNVVGIIPAARGGVAAGLDPLEECYRALERGEILLIFPGGLTRGTGADAAEPGAGISYLAKRFPTVPVIPVFMRGLGKSMGRGRSSRFPFFVDVAVGRPFSWTGEKNSFMDRLRDAFAHLQKKFVAQPPD